MNCTINTSSSGYVSAQVTNSGEVLLAFCNYPASGSTVISISEASKLADLLHEIANPKLEPVQEAA